MKIIRISVIILLIALLFSGCQLWTAGEYYSEYPHLDESGLPASGDVEVKRYDQLCQQLLRMVSTGTETCVIHYRDFSEATMDGYMNRAISYVLEETPIGAYAVDEIAYESGTNTGKQAVAVTISYNHGRTEILRIQKVQTMEQLHKAIGHSLQNCDPALTVSVMEYTQLDLQQFVQDYMDQNPDVCMELPQVVATVYPEEGTTRIVEILFSYQNSREELRKMQQTVAPVFDSAELYVSGDAAAEEKYFQLYSFLMERHDYQLETSITPAYHLLRHGVGDSKAFATVYAAMCRRAGLDCGVVTGTKEGEICYWNVILKDDIYWYVDLLACSERGKFMMNKTEEMTGYVWDYDLYPTVTSEDT